MAPILQITLNFLGLDGTIKAAKSTVDYADWIGIGNSLIKIRGIEAISRIKEEFTEKRIVADMIVMDSPDEVEIASRAGADIITVSGISDNSVILACVNTGRINGTEVIADLRNLNQIKERGQILEKTGVNYLLLDYENIGEIYDSVQIPIIAACPIDREAITHAVDSGADIVELRLNNEDDLRRFAGVKRVIRGEFSLSRQDTPTREELEKITNELGDIKKILTSLKILPRQNLGKKEHGQKREIMGAEGEWEKIKRAGEIVENQKKKIADEMRQIEWEWREIERVKKDMEKKDMGKIKIIDNPEAGTEVKNIEMHTERGIEDDLLRIREEHKKRKEI